MQQLPEKRQILGKVNGKWWSCSFLQKPFHYFFIFLGQNNPYGENRQHTDHTMFCRCSNPIGDDTHAQKKLRKSHKKNLVPDKMLDVSEIASRLSKQCTNVVNESILNLIDLTV